VNVRFGPVESSSPAPAEAAQQDPWNSAPDRGGFGQNDGSEPPF